jgi:hypothetical protein
MRITHTARDGGAADLTELVASAAWSGDYTQAARTLDVRLAANARDPYLPKVHIDNGEVLSMFTDGGAELFRGYVFRREARAQPGETALLAYDGLANLARSDITRNWAGRTMEEIVRDVCAEFGVEVGEISDSGGERLSIPWVGKSAYRAIMAALTKISDSTGLMYQPVMHKGLLHVISRGASVCRRELSGGSDIAGATYSSSIEDMANRVLILDGKGAAAGSVENADDARNYGLLQKAYKQEEGKDARAQAEKLLKGIENTAEIAEFAGGDDCLDMVSGNAIYVSEPVTGLVGKFFIDTDTHTFSGGRHMVSLGLAFRLAMDREEAEAEKAEKKAGGKGDGKVGGADIWAKYDAQWKEAHGW